MSQSYLRFTGAIVLVALVAGCEQAPTAPEGPDASLPAPIVASSGPIGDYVQVAAGTTHTCALRAQGSIVCWGNNAAGRTSPPPGSFTQIDVGTNHGCAVRQDGTLACWGINNHGQAAPPPGTFTQVATGTTHSCAVRTDEGIQCWGSNFVGESSPPTGRYTQVSALNFVSCAVEVDGDLRCWGSNSVGELLHPAGTFRYVSVGNLDSCAIRDDGTIACWGPQSGGTLAPPAGNFTQLSVLTNHACAVRSSDSSVVCWGTPPNNFGDATPPAGTFTEVSVGFIHACAVTTAGAVTCWGGNFSGQATPPGNLPPDVDIGGPYGGSEGTAIAFEGTASDAELDTPLSFAWDFDNNGTFETTGATASHAFADNGDLTVALRVTDARGAARTVTTTVAVTNVSPTIDPIDGATLTAGDAYESSGSFTDPGSADTWTATVDYGDGGGVEPLSLDGQTFQLSHQYDEAGSYTVTVSVTDDDGGEGTRTAQVEVEARPSALALVIDEDAIDNGSQPNRFSDSAVNDNRARLGQRAPLPAFDGANIGREYTLYTGQVGDEGFFALKSIPSEWSSTGPTSDGVRNYFGDAAAPYPHDVGRGLGTGSDPERWLDKVPNVTPLRATGLRGLEGQAICAVVYDSDVSMNYGPLNGSLKGETLGTVAFRVLSSTPLFGQSSGSLPSVRVEVLDVRTTCGGTLDLYQNAPEPRSSSEPYDTGR